MNQLASFFYLFCVCVLNAPHALRSHTPPPPHASRDDEQAFLKVFDQLRAELVQAEKDDAQVQIAVDWIDKMVEYNVPHGEGVSQLPFCSLVWLHPARQYLSTVPPPFFHSFTLSRFRTVSRVCPSRHAPQHPLARHAQLCFSYTAVFLVLPPLTHRPTQSNHSWTNQKEKSKYLESPRALT